MAEYRPLAADEIDRELFRSFIRRQVVVKCWRRDEAGGWVVRDDPFIDDWSEEDYHALASCLRNTVQTGGVVYAAFVGGVLKGYLDLTNIHVSQDMRGGGMGRALFRLARDWARAHGARKLYISAHSAVETQAFYRSLGCVEAEVYHQGHAEAEPFDCQLECPLA